MTTRKATKTDVKREAQRVFGDGITVVGPRRDETGIGRWMVRVSAWHEMDLTRYVFTKQCALQDAFDCLAKLERKT